MLDVEWTILRQLEPSIAEFNVCVIGILMAGKFQSFGWKGFIGLVSKRQRTCSRADVVRVVVYKFTRGKEAGGEGGEEGGGQLAASLWNTAFRSSAWFKDAISTRRDQDSFRRCRSRV